MRTTTSATVTDCRSPTVEGTGEVPTPGSGAPLKPGEFFLGYPDEAGPPARLPQPEILSRNGSFLAYRRLQEHVGAFREFLRQTWRDARGTGTDRGEADGALAQRRPAGSRSGERRSSPRCGPAAEQ